MTVHWVVAGARGQLGSALVDRLSAAGGLVLAFDLPELDVADPVAVKEALASQPRPLVVANAAAFTHVDRCEREPEAAHRGNAVAPAVLAGVCTELGAQLVHVSTDYVFAGDAGDPYPEDHPTDPRSTYGRTKLEGERTVLGASDAFLVLRTSWVFGRGRNFVAAILDQAAKRRSGELSGPLRVVDDQRGRPTYAVDLAEALVALVAQNASGVYHVANEGVASWWDFARRILDTTGYADLEIERVRTASLDLPAPRPAWSVLDTRKALAAGVRLRSWQDALSAYLTSDHSPVAPAANTEENDE